MIKLNFIKRRELQIPTVFGIDVRDINWKGIGVVMAIIITNDIYLEGFIVKKKEEIKLKETEVR